MIIYLTITKTNIIVNDNLVHIIMIMVFVLLCQERSSSDLAYPHVYI